MKKILAIFVVMFTILTVNAQSFQWHQSYGGNQKLISDYSWVSDLDNTWAVFSWNEFTVKGDGTITGRGLLYNEFRIGMTDFYVHPEVRLNTDGNFLNLGFAYRIPFEKLNIYLTPQYSFHQQGFGTDYVSDLQFSINSSWENDYFYYEGYFDSYWFNGISCFTEQKFYYKINQTLQIGANLVFGANSDEVTFYPMLVGRISLY